MRYAMVRRGVVDDALRVVDADTMLLLGGAVVVILLGLTWLLIRWFRRSPGLRFQRMLAGYDSVDVLMHPNPDPDAMSSALAVSFLADTVDTDTRLLFSGQIRHQENRAFRTVLDVDLTRIKSAEELESEALVLVDHNRPRGFSGAEGLSPDALIDHHPGSGEAESFTDARTNYGACATILTEYVREIGAQPEVDDEEVDIPVPWEVSTGLLYGIQSDTNHLTKGCTPSEFEAAGYLFPGIDEDALDRIANPEVSAETLEIKARAIHERTVKGSFAVADVGNVLNIDAIPQAADELLTLEGVTAVVVYGNRDGELTLSGRSRDDRVHMGDVLSAVTSDIPMASAEGHARMGGGQISIAHMEGIGPSEGISEEQFTDRLFSAMSGDI